MNPVPDDRLFSAHPKEFGSIDAEVLDMKAGNLTVRQLITILKMVKVGRDPAIIKHSEAPKTVMKALTENPDGITPWDLSKKYNEKYSVVRYYLKSLLIEGKVIVEKQKNKDKREITLYKLAALEWKEQSATM